MAVLSIYYLNPPERSPFKSTEARRRVMALCIPGSSCPTFQRTFEEHYFLILFSNSRFLALSKAFLGGVKSPAIHSDGLGWAPPLRFSTDFYVFPC